MPPLFLPEQLPPVKTPMVPVIRRSESAHSQKNTGQGIAQDRHPPRRRYGEDPLPVKPSTRAPRSARIIHRNDKNFIVSYSLQIGETKFEDVLLPEVLEWVSPLELEAFEYARFLEEGELQKVEDIEKEVQKPARVKARATTKGTVSFENVSDDVDESAGNAGIETVVGKHSRARPTYNHFYKRSRQRGKGVSNDLGSTEEDLTVQIDKGQRAPASNSAHFAGSLEEITKRRRRKRHPITGELMPIGWRYDAEHDEDGHEMRRAGLGPGQDSASFNRLSISEQPSKRMRLDTGSAVSLSSSPAPTKAEIMSGIGNSALPKTSMEPRTTSVIDLESSDEDELHGPPSTTTSLNRKPTLQQARNSITRGVIESTATTSGETSPEPAPTTSITRPLAPEAALSPSASRQTPKLPLGMTSITSPTAGRVSSPDLLANASESEEDSDVDEGEWFIEGIRDHQLSDPRTHPEGLGSKAVMLYSVKWEGYEEPTWEPIDSFGDKDLVHDYHKKRELPPLPRDDQEGSTSEPPRSKPPPQAPAARTTLEDSGKADESEEVEEDEYEIERITAHHLSDPRTHPTELGKTPVMLYQVKWKGFKELTWEPEVSFGGSDMLKAYKKQKGMDRAGAQQSKSEVGLVGRLLT